MKFRSFILLIFLTIIFSFLIFFAKNYFFGGRQNFENELIEEKYIEPIVRYSEIDRNEEKNDGKEQVEVIVFQEIPELTSAPKIKYTYSPNNFGEEEKVGQYKETLDNFFKFSTIEEKILLLEVLLNKEKGEVRGKMQNKVVKLFGVYNMKLEEFLAVSIHEFAHFFDLYILDKKNSLDLSDYFYDISWETALVVKPGLSQTDFVSGYAMTNKYEEFAETFTYYVLHNDDFLKKAENSKLLKEKYSYFQNYIFKDFEFVDLPLSTDKTIKDYYRDITKIGYSLNNFLQYLKKGV